MSPTCSSRPRSSSPFVVIFARRLAQDPDAPAVRRPRLRRQLAVFAYLQFGYHVQTLEMHFFSSTLWGVVCLALAYHLAEISRPDLVAARLARWLPAALVLAVPLVVSRPTRTCRLSGGCPVGAAWSHPCLSLIAAADAAVCDATGAAHSAKTRLVVCAVVLSVVGMTGSLLVLTVAPRPDATDVRDLRSAGDPFPATTSWLSEGAEMSSSTGTRSAPPFPVLSGDPSYKGEQLLMWFSWGVRQAPRAGRHLP